VPTDFTIRVVEEASRRTSGGGVTGPSGSSAPRGPAKSPKSAPEEAAQKKQSKDVADQFREITKLGRDLAGALGLGGFLGVITKVTGAVKTLVAVITAASAVEGARAGFKGVGGAARVGARILGAAIDRGSFRGVGSAAGGVGRTGTSLAVRGGGTAVAARAGTALAVRGGAAAGGTAVSGTAATGVAVAGGGAAAGSLSLPVIGIAIAAFIAATTAAVVALKLLTGALDKAAAPLVGLSPELSAAAAHADVARLMRDIDRAERLGPGLAEVQNTRVKFELMMSEVWTQILENMLRLIEPMLPFIELAVQTMTAIVSLFGLLVDTAFAILKALSPLWLIQKILDALSTDHKKLFLTIREFHAQYLDDADTKLDTFTDQFMKLVPLKKGMPPIDGRNTRGEANLPPKDPEE